MSKHSIILQVSLFCLLSWFYSPLNAEDYLNPSPLCRALQEQIPQRPADLQDAVAHEGTLVYLSGNQLDVSQMPNFHFPDFANTASEIAEDEQVYEVSGNVYLQREQQLVKAENLRYQKNDGTIKASGEVTFWDQGFIAQSPKVLINQDRSGSAQMAKYWLLEARARGEADTVIRHDLDNIELQQADYSTCPGDKPFWQLRARHTQLDLAQDIGVSRDVRLYLGKYPVFYTPYISFPLSDKRKSGLLPPKFGYSSERGVEASIPYYWNIAPNYDATFAPLIMTKRGVRLDTEMRYLSRHSQGVWEWHFMPTDNEYEDAQRYQLQIEHLTQFTPRLSAALLYNEVSDNDYFSDFSNTLETSSITHLLRQASLTYLGSWYLLQAGLQNYQTLSENPAARPYERLPQITAQTLIPETNAHLHLSATAEYVYFERNLPDESDYALPPNPTGHRTHATLGVGLPWRSAWSFFKPKLTGYLTQYNLSDNGENDSLSRGLYSFSADSGLFMEREAGRGLLQTLEPRLFYLFIPHEDQQDIPIFDSAEYDFSFAQMFRENRFVGNDRIGDENRVALALTSRLLDATDGEEYLRASIGQSYHFAERQVSLTNTVNDSDSSDIIAELAARIAQNLTATQTLQWDSDDHSMIRSSTRLRYHNPEQGQIFNMAYRSRKNLREDLEQTDLSWYWPVNKNWSAIGRWNYSLEHGKNLETFAGFEYNSCCWAVRLLGRRYLQNLEGDYATGAFVQIELKGLTGFGRSTGRFLSESIGGFEDNLTYY